MKPIRWQTKNRGKLIVEVFANFFQWPSQEPQLQFLSEVPFRFFIVMEPLPVSVLLMYIPLK